MGVDNFIPSTQEHSIVATDILQIVECWVYSPHSPTWTRAIIHLHIVAMTKKFPLQPLGDRVVVKPSEKGGEKKLSSGIILPETANKEKLMQGDVVAVGAGRRNDAGARISMEVGVGDTVFFKKPWDEPIKIDGTEYYVLSESEIIGISN